MLNIGPQELLLILVVALVVVGPRRLPELSRSIGKALRSLRAAQDEMRKTVNEVLDPNVVGEVTEGLRQANAEVREALRPDPPGGRRARRSPPPTAAAPRAPVPPADAEPSDHLSAESSSEPDESPGPGTSA